ncbi:MAG TPA: hypothetical protein VHC41_08315 [Mycobacteriales bacterium]|nr:hypothetical protein [Mycobacteriales bacterium]
MSTASAVTGDPFGSARAVADAVLFEGYVLYPYRASATKNQLRWQWGVLAPEPYARAHAEASSLCAQTLLDVRGAAGATVRIQLRFLQVQHRDVQQWDGERFCDVSVLPTADADHVPWDEAVELRRDVAVGLDRLLTDGLEVEFDIPGGREDETVLDGEVTVGRLRRTRRPLRARLRAGATALPGPYGCVRLVVDVENRGAQAGPADQQRETAMRDALVACHLLLAVDADLRFLSLADPPEWAREYAAGCHNVGTWPVLVAGDDGQDVVLCSPIILDEHPVVAAESSALLYDSLEIDEILTLRTMTLTEAEKRAARGTDARAAAVVSGADALPPELLDRLHGAIRSVRPVTGIPQPAPEPPTPQTDVVEISGRRVGCGCKVRLHPGVRGSDAQDMFVTGRIATVQAVLRDLDGGTHLAVSVDDDPATDLQLAHGRFRYFAPDEVEPLEVGS